MGAGNRLGSAGIGKDNQANGGKELQLKAGGAHLPLRSCLRFGEGLVPGLGEMLVPAPAAPSAAARLLMLGVSWLAAVFARIAAALVARRPIGSPWVAPLQSGAAHLSRSPNRTEHPDGLNWALAPVLYLALAFVGVALVPFSTSGALVALPAGIVLGGAVASLTVGAVFLHGWSAHALGPLLGPCRSAAVGLPALRASMCGPAAPALPERGRAPLPADRRGCSGEVAGAVALGAIRAFASRVVAV